MWIWVGLVSAWERAEEMERVVVVRSITSTEAVVILSGLVVYAFVDTLITLPPP
jgi:hypothetical protein